MNGQLMERVFDIQEQGVGAMLAVATSSDKLSERFLDQSYRLERLEERFVVFAENQPKGFISGVIAPVAKKVNAPAWMQSDNWTMRLFLTATIILLVWLVVGRDGAADMLYFIGDTLAKKEVPSG
ncbi:MAG: hypothetical protein GY812_16675 [Actinomycetia bacterium]|nr:hypothetical protein [Actinomycetes bacterium]